MDPTTFIYSARQQSLAPENYPFEISAFEAATPTELASVIFRSGARRSMPGLPAAVDRTRLASIVSAFHRRAGTVTERVTHELDRLTEGAPIIRAAHQANVLPYMGVLGQLFLLDAIASRARQEQSIACCQMFFVVDHDFAGDKRFRMSRFPAARYREGSATLGYPIARAHFGRVNRAIDKPAETLIADWLSTARHITTEEARLLRRAGIRRHFHDQLEEKLEVIARELEEARQRASNLSEFNAILLSRIANLHWGLPTLFLPLSSVVPSLQTQLEYLVQQYPSIASTFEKRAAELSVAGLELPISKQANLEMLPLWYVCESCESRVPLRVLFPPRLLVQGSCASCSREYRFDLGTYDAPRLESISERVAPRVLIDNLLDVVGIGISGGVGYIGGAEHVLAAALIATNLGWGVTPDCLWRPFGAYYGSAESLAGAAECGYSLPVTDIHAREVFELACLGRASLIYYLLSSGIAGVSQMWQQQFDSNSSVDSVNYGQGELDLAQDVADHIRSTVSRLHEHQLAEVVHVRSQTSS